MRGEDKTSKHLRPEDGSDTAIRHDPAITQASPLEKCNQNEMMEQKTTDDLKESTDACPSPPPPLELEEKATASGDQPEEKRVDAVKMQASAGLPAPPEEEKDGQETLLVEHIQQASDRAKEAKDRFREEAKTNKLTNQERRKEESKLPEIKHLLKLKSDYQEMTGREFHNPNRPRAGHAEGEKRREKKERKRQAGRNSTEPVVMKREENTIRDRLRGCVDTCLESKDGINRLFEACKSSLTKEVHSLPDAWINQTAIMLVDQFIDVFNALPEESKGTKDEGDEGRPPGPNKTRKKNRKKQAKDAPPAPTEHQKERLEALKAARIPQMQVASDLLRGCKDNAIRLVGINKACQHFQAILPLNLVGSQKPLPINRQESQEKRITKYRVKMEDFKQTVLESRSEGRDPHMKSIKFPLLAPKERSEIVGIACELELHVEVVTVGELPTYTHEKGVYDKDIGRGKGGVVPPHVQLYDRFRESGLNPDISAFNPYNQARISSTPHKAPSAEEKEAIPRERKSSSKKRRRRGREDAGLHMPKINPVLGGLETSSNSYMSDASECCQVSNLEDLSRGDELLSSPTTVTGFSRSDSVESVIDYADVIVWVPFAEDTLSQFKRSVREGV